MKMTIGLTCDVTFDGKQYIAKIPPHYQVEAKTIRQLRLEIAGLWRKLEALSWEHGIFSEEILHATFIEGKRP